MLAIRLHKTPKEIREQVSPAEAEQIAFILDKQAVIEEGKSRAQSWLASQKTGGVKSARR